jgi:hypothetical protein
MMGGSEMGFVYWYKFKDSSGQSKSLVLKKNNSIKLKVDLQLLTDQAVGNKGLAKKAFL